MLVLVGWSLDIRSKLLGGRGDCATSPIDLTLCKLSSSRTFEGLVDIVRLEWCGVGFRWLLHLLVHSSACPKE